MSSHEAFLIGDEIKRCKQAIKQLDKDANSELIQEYRDSIIKNRKRINNINKLKSKTVYFISLIVNSYFKGLISAVVAAKKDGGK